LVLGFEAAGSHACGLLCCNGQRRNSAYSLTLSWPVEATNYVLEAATSQPALSWAPVTNPPIVSATERSVQLPLTGNAKFFRLRKP
jgi:hypothetical protein